MAGYSNNQTDFNPPDSDVESLIAQLRQRNASSGSAPTPQAPGSSFLTQIASQQLASQSNPYFAQSQSSHLHGYHHASVSSALPTPPIFNNQSPHHTSAVMSPVSETGPSRSVAVLNDTNVNNADRTANLLNLLKFSQPATSSPPNPKPISPPPVLLNQVQQSAESRGTADLLATLMGSTSHKETRGAPSMPQIQAPLESGSAIEDSATPADTQAYLLQLLNRPKPAQTDGKSAITPTKVTRSFSENPALLKSSHESVINTTQPSTEAFVDGIASTTQPQAASEPAKNNKTLFNYVNPFEQLAASSPRNHTPTPSAATQQSAVKAPVQILKPPRHTFGSEISVHKTPLPTVSPTHTKRDLSSPEPLQPSTAGLSQATDNFGIGSTKQPTETVSQAINEAANQANKEANEALARAVNSVSENLDAKDPSTDTAVNSEDDSVNKLASLIEKKDLLKDEGIMALSEAASGVASSTVKSVVNNTVQDTVVDSWESADADAATIESTDKSGRKNVKVYNFPLKPWVSITLQPGSNVDRPTFDPDSAMAIARLRKAFDQNDRTLVTATNNFIVFAMSKNGGIRIIRQDSGRDKKIFDETRDQVFNVSASTSNRDGLEAVIGTGCSGTVYWAAVKDTGGDKIEEFTSKSSFALPPIQSPGDENPGGVLKTRARKSSTHPEFFAVGRGKSIHIIFPYLITESGLIIPGPDRLVDVDKYLSHRTLKIDTGKAAKDFTFSQDDTTVVSLDKAGRVKFWDVRGLTSENQPKNQSIEIKEPLMTLITTPASEKSWPTSVIFVDKVRPYLKGCALRYLIVGMKQNHTLQLWDLALGKPVQELHLPHDKESDAACSVVYHATTGVIVVGHPTRNSIYFIHLSAPKYNLPKSLSQSEFIERLVKKDKTIPSPESTAVMSGIREYIFSEAVETKEGSDKRARGDLRSLDILQPVIPTSPAKPDATLFELYAMHSTGVTCISVKPETLGWDSHNRAVNPASAMDEGIITVGELKPTEPPTLRETLNSSVSVATTASVATPKGFGLTKEAGRKQIVVNTQTEKPIAPSGSPAKKVEQTQTIISNGQDTAISGTEKIDKKKKKKAAASARHPDNIMETSSTSSKSSQGTTNGVPEALVGVVSQDQINKALKTVDGSISEMTRQLNASIDKVYQSFHDDKKSQTAAEEEKQVNLLRVVANTLAENVDKTLGSIVETNTKKILLPALTDSVSKAVSKNVHDHLSNKLGALVQASVTKEIQAAMPGALGKALEKREFMRNISASMTESISGNLVESLTDSVSSAVMQKVTFKFEESLAKFMKNEMIPSFNILATRTAQISAVDIQRSVSDRISQLERQSQSDSNEIKKLSNVIEGLTEMISTMASAQEGFQAAVLRGNNSIARSIAEQTTGSQKSIREAPPTSHRAESPVSTFEQLDSDQGLYERSFKTIAHLMSDGEFEAAMMTWIKLNNTKVMQNIFDDYFSKYDPGFMREVSPILSLSTAATISQSFDSPSLMERIQWLETILQIYQSFSPEDIDPDVVKPCATLMELLKERFEHLFMRVSQASAHDPLLKRLHTLVTVATRIMENMQQTFH